MGKGAGGSAKRHADAETADDNERQCAQDERQWEKISERKLIPSELSGSSGISMLGAWMRFVVRLFDALHRHMGVNLCRRQVDVTEQRLDASQIGAVIQKMRRKAVAKFVGADAEVGWMSAIDASSASAI